MNEPWRFTYTFTTGELTEYLRNIRRGTFTSHAGYMLQREVYLQAEERQLIRLPEGAIRGDCHRLPFSQLTILNDAINRDE